METKRKQCRLNLAFRETDPNHVEAYKRLSSMSKSTDYIVALMARENQVAQQQPAAVDIPALCDTLLPLIENAIAAAVTKALADKTISTVHSEEQATLPRPVPSNMELGLKGLEAFYSE